MIIAEQLGWAVLEGMRGDEIARAAIMCLAPQARRTEGRGINRLDRPKDPLPDCDGGLRERPNVRERREHRQEEEEKEK